MPTARKKPPVFRCSTCSSAIQFTLIAATIDSRIFQQLQPGKWKRIRSARNPFIVPLAVVCETCCQVLPVPASMINR